MTFGNSARWRGAALLALLCAAIAGTGCGSSADSVSEEDEGRRTTVVLEVAEREPKVPLPQGEPPDGLVVRDLRPGWGVAAREGDVLTTRFASRYADGRPFESSWNEGESPFVFQLGAGESNPGWEKGMRGMRVGGRRLLIVPPEMGSRFGPLPADSTLVYLVELTGIEPPELKERREPSIAVPPGRPPKELRVRDLVEGRGPEAKPGDVVTMSYASRRYSGEPFSNSWDDGHPFRIHLGAGTYKSIPGWEEGLPGMRVGGRRELIVPPEWIFQTDPPPGSKPSETLVYIVDLRGVTEQPGQPSGPTGPS